MAKKDSSGSGKWTRWNNAVKKGFASPARKRQASTKVFNPADYPF